MKKRLQKGRWERLAQIMASWRGPTPLHPAVLWTQTGLDSSADWCRKANHTGLIRPHKMACSATCPAEETEPRALLPRQSCLSTDSRAYCLIAECYRANDQPFSPSTSKKPQSGLSVERTASSRLSHSNTNDGEVFLESEGCVLVVCRTRAMQR
jgi:hypothetical protein